MSRRRRPLVASEALSCLDWHLSLSLSLPFFFQTAKWNLTPCVWFFPCSDKMIGRGRELKFETDWEDWGEPFFSWRCRCRFGGCLISSSFDSDHPGKANCIVRSEKEDLFEGTRGVCRAYGNVGKNQWFGRWGPSLDKGTEGCHVDEMCWQAWSRVIFSVIVWSEVSTFYCACYACLLVLGLSALVGEAALWIVRIITAWN